jgi:hypothetical protein
MAMLSRPGMWTGLAFLALIPVYLAFAYFGIFHRRRIAVDLGAVLTYVTVGAAFVVFAFMLGTMHERAPRLVTEWQANKLATGFAEIGPGKVRLLYNGSPAAQHYAGFFRAPFRAAGWAVDGPHVAASSPFNEQEGVALIVARQYAKKGETVAHVIESARIEVNLIPERAQQDSDLLDGWDIVVGVGDRP